MDDEASRDAAESGARGEGTRPATADDVAPDDAWLREDPLDSQVVHEGRYLSFRIDHVRTPEGRRARREVVGHPGAVAVVALDRDGAVLLVRQWRHAAGRALLEIPAGTLDRGTDGVPEDPDRAARRELEEETGFRAERWRKLGEFWTAPGFTTELMHLYLATGLEPAGDDRLAPDQDERFVLEHVPLGDAVALVLAGGVQDAKSVAGILWAARALDEA
jgi:ADP-ribose pyrophosphatase